MSEGLKKVMVYFENRNKIRIRIKIYLEVVLKLILSIFVWKGI